MGAQNSRTISVLHNGLKLDGIVSGTNIIYLQDTSGNVILGTDVNGNWYGTAVAPRTAAITANDDGTGTAVIKDNVDFVTVTSAGATKQVALPAASASTVGREIKIFVGSNGFELITSSDAQTINGSDSDGTNQLDVAASSLLRCVQVSATGWYVFQETASALSVVAPDND